MVFEAKPYQYKKNNSKRHDFSMSITSEVEFKGEAAEYDGLRMAQAQSHSQNKFKRRAKNNNIEIIRAFESGVL